MSKGIRSVSRTLFGGNDAGSQQSAQQSSMLDPRVFALMKENYGRAQKTANQLGARQFAGFSPLQQQGFNFMGSLNQGFTPQAMQAAEQGIAGMASNAFLGGRIADYQNPYTQQVIDTAMGDLDRARLMQQQGVNAQALSRGAFGGSRQAVAEAENNRNFLDQQARTSAGLRAQGYESALSAAQADRQAQMQNYELMNRSFLGNIAAQLQAGGTQQALEQQRMDAVRNLPLEQLQITSGALGLNPFGGAGNVSQGSSQGTSFQRSDPGLLGGFFGLFK